MVGKYVEAAYTGMWVCLRCSFNVHIDHVPGPTGRTMSSEIGQADEIFLRILYLGACDCPQQDVNLERRSNEFLTSESSRVNNFYLACSQPTSLAILAAASPQNFNSVLW